ncbi:P-loop containing nucleoside triphosphate hydrolase protein [Lentithecium fluviatile CBS 122367]|uniref:Origin recognition complex subunit 4 n=1 Tax=Lentithecium fluviatile CBS 122367 TaxID=1168545 RepID=A0A6G1J313_9PLEO|nr:P-loop containing nucleoside triphosphate hydrolase protein [Lentithecium fluviatile CBS 122367]
MDGSPRASKRRKLDTPSRVVSSPLTKVSSARKSGRLINRSVSHTVGALHDNEERATPSKGAGRTPNGVAKGPGRPRKKPEEKDVWDDIEGALGESPLKTKPQSTRSNRKRDTESTSNETDELQEARSTPKKGRGGDTIGKESASRKSFRSLVNGFQHGAEVEADIQDELAAEAPTPARRVHVGKTRTTSTRKQRGGEKDAVDTPPRYGSLRKPTTSVRRRATSEAGDELAYGTPSWRTKRQPQFDERSTVAETDDELDQPAAPSPSQPASVRRRANRADNTSNRVSEVVEGSDEEQADAGADMNGDAMSIDGNSIVGSVLDPTEPSPFNKPVSAQKEKPVLPLLNGHLEQGRELDLLKTVVLERITGKRPAPLIGIDEEYKTVYQLIEQTITAGEGNSMLLIGARGSGKTSLINKVLSEVSKDNSEDYHVVRLNGFIHTDDKIALREIWRQLGKEMDLEEDSGGVGKNYADTLTTLLALLSHPSEHTGEVTDQIAKAVIFIMDEFDLFAQHPRQTLLYNLFDIAQSRKAPIAVLGLTTRIDVANSLEKRVKSRFSHRYVHLSLAKTFTAFQEMCKANLSVQSEHLSIEERGILEATVKTPAKKGKKGAKQDVLSEWNANIDALFISKTFLSTHLAPHFYCTKSILSILNSFLLPTATLSSTLPLSSSNLTTPPDSKLTVIPTLSTLSLSLLIAACRLDIIHDSDSCNFNMAYDEYVTLTSKARIQSAAGGLSAAGGVSKVWGKDVARREWEGLVELGLVIPVYTGLTGGFGMVRCDISLEEVGAVLAGGGGVGGGLERWCRQI